MRSLPLLAALAAAAPVASTAQKAEGPHFSPNAVKSHVEFLASDDLEGRNAGTRGYDLAARYVATRFAGWGLKPAGTGWYQQVPFVESRLAGGKPPVLTIGGRAFVNKSDVLIGQGATEPSQSLTAQVVFAGFCLDAPDQGFDDYRGLDVRGKAVACLAGFPKGTPSDIGAHLNNRKAKMAEARGATGMLELQTTERLKTRPWARAVELGGSKPALRWAEANGQPYVDAPGIRIAASLNTPAAEALFAGAPRNFKAILAEADKPRAKVQGFALKQPVKFERSVEFRRFTSPNVLGVLPGSDPRLKDEYVLLMAHLDHEGVDPSKKGDQTYNGAMDNAAGIATMLEVAHAMVESGSRPRRSILFAAVTAEEDGLLGAQYLAKHPVLGGGKVVGVVNLDMPILLYDFKDVIAFGAEHSTLGPIVARATAQAGVKTSPDPMPAEGLFTRSDHYMFVREGVPSVFLMTGFANGGEKAFKDFLATHYHRVSDEPTLPIDWNAGAKFARINYLIAREIADAPEAPRWYADSFFGKAFAPNAAKAFRAPAIMERRAAP